MFRTKVLAVVASLAFASSACSDDPPHKSKVVGAVTLGADEPLDQSFSDLGWSKCIFELDKIEAIRGRNLDDLDAGTQVLAINS